MLRVLRSVSIAFKILTSISITLEISVGHLIGVEMMVVVVLNSIPILKISVSQLIRVILMIIDLNTPELLIVIPFSTTATSLSVIS
jgi:hypothetical protein